MKYILLFISLGSFSVFAQFNTSILDHNNVSAHVTDGGLLFNNTMSGPGYEIPKGSGLNAIYSSSLWFGAQDASGQLHLSGTRFIGGEDIFPGPIADSGMYTSSAYLNEYTNSIWYILKDDVVNHIANWNQPGYNMSPAIANWPGNGDPSIGVAEQLAPYVDVNNNGVYEPSLGDYPNIRGDEARYIIMNDAAQVHTSTGGLQLGIEVHLMVYQYATNDFLNDVTFINARVFNRGNTTYPDFRTSYYVDADIGGAFDDYIGSDSLRNMIFMYNGDVNDEGGGGAAGYGANPPAIGITSLKTTMSGAAYYTNGGAATQSDPSSAGQFWNYMNNKWRFGDPWVYGGTGFPGSSGSTTTPTNYLFSGDPSDSTGWSEGTQNNPAGDRRGVMNLESTSLAPSQMLCYDLAVVFGEGMAPFGSVDDLKNNVDLTQNFFDAQSFDCETVSTVGIGEHSLLETSIYPSPSSGELHIVIQQPIDHFSVNVFDLAGRVVYSQEFDNQQ
jgi:hypothetical protein